MNKFLKKYIINVGVLLILFTVFSNSATYNDNIVVLLVAGIILTLLNIIIKPVLNILALPITIITLGLFSFVVNAFVIKLTDWVIPQIKINSFGVCIIGAILITIINLIVKEMDKENK